MSEDFTISEIHESMRSGEITAEGLVDSYRERIETHDSQFNAVVTINPNARERARELDSRLEESGLSGPLHGIPVVAKDQTMTADITTTFGSKLFEEFVPHRDATIVTKLRDAGAIIVGKTAMNDWAAGSSGISSIVGQTKNPYDLDRDPAGSSSGTGAAVAANLATVGIGEDTGGSIRAPSSCCNLFGIRVTTGLVSRSGLSPLVERHDTAGPMARTVADLVRLLDAITGYDADDPATGTTSMADVDSYEQALGEETLDGARIGVLRSAFGDSEDPDCAPVNNIVENRLEEMADAGAILVDVSIPNLEAYLDEASLYEYQARHDITSFLQTLESPPVSSLDEIMEMGAYPEKMTSLERMADGYDEPTDHVDYWQAVEKQKEFRDEVTGVFAAEDLDAIAFPDLKIVPRRIGDLPQDQDAENYLINTFIASFSSCPAISVPGGLTDDGLPVGVELLGTPLSEETLLSIAADYEALVDPREAPSTSPALD
jgi:amidase